MVPLNVHLGDQTWRDQVDLTTPHFMEMLAESDQFPTTSQPSAGVFEQVFRELAETHDEIVCVLISSRLSGTVQSAQIAATAVADTIHVEVVDSLNASLGCGFQAMHAQRLADAGERAEAIATHAPSPTGTRIFFSKRHHPARRALRIRRPCSLKPLLRIDEAVVPFERTRTRRKAPDAGRIRRTCPASTYRRAALTTPDDAEALYAQSRLSPAIGRVPIAWSGRCLARRSRHAGLAIEVAASE